MAFKFDVLCCSLDVIYLALGLISIVQLLRLQKRDEGISCSWCCFRPVTVQQIVHFIILGLCAVRASFFICAIHSWDPIVGKVTRAKVEFYSLDEVSNILFFSLASVLALFWAELYYISIDRAETFTCIVRPVTYVLNGIAIIGVITLSCIVSKNFSSDVDYVFVQFAILVTITYLIAAIMFTYYAYMSALELEKVPLPMIARRDRLFSLRMLACVTIVALILKASAVLYMNGKSVATDTVVSLFLVFVYFVFCEILPVCIILVFYRVDSWNGESSSGRSDIDSNTGELSTRNARIAPSMRSASGEAQPEVVDAIIARLSLETGTGTVSKERQSGDIDDPMEREGLLGAKGSSRYQNLSL